MMKIRTANIYWALIITWLVQARAKCSTDSDHFVSSATPWRGFCLSYHFAVEDLGREICLSSRHPVCLPTSANTAPNPYTHLFLTITLRRTLHSETCLLWPQLSLFGTYRHSRRRRGDRVVKTGKVCARSNASFHAVRLPHSSWL